LAKTCRNKFKRKLLGIRIKTNTEARVTRRAITAVEKKWGQKETE